mmetsp:Transcript_131999/g.333554  ORF Transcript_131999/g.333554 Transcript_131999/m.333554 type:complete len:215 (+) Transcript_131999:194-838(+)
MASPRHDSGKLLEISAFVRSCQHLVKTMQVRILQRQPRLRIFLWPQPLISWQMQLPLPWLHIPSPAPQSPQSSRAPSPLHCWRRQSPFHSTQRSSLFPQRGSNRFSLSRQRYWPPQPHGRRPQTPCLRTQTPWLCLRRPEGCSAQCRPHCPLRPLLCRCPLLPTPKRWWPWCWQRLRRRSLWLANCRTFCQAQMRTTRLCWWQRHLRGCKKTAL